jgi:putative membrane protein
MSALLRTTEAQLSFRSGSFASLTKQAADKRADLAKLSGAAFDKAYIDNEVAYHKTVNAALQKTLIPSASNQELKDLLTTGLKIFQGHEQHAEHVAMEFK